MGFVISKAIPAIFLVLFLTMGVNAIPAIPHQFWGTVSINGSAAPNGTAITTIVNSVANSSTTVSSGKYGFAPNTFFVTDPNGTYDGKTITFFVNGTQAATYAFFNSGGTELNLAITTAPGPNPNPDPGNPGSPGGGGGGGGGGSGGGSACVKTSFDQDGDCVKRDKDCNDLNKDTKQCSASQSCELVDGLRQCVDNAGEEPAQEFDEGITVLPDTGSGTPDFCSGVACNDANPCTADSCDEGDGSCNYSNVADGTACANGICSQGKCVSEQSSQNNLAGGNQANGATALFTLSDGTFNVLLLILGVIGLIAVVFGIKKFRNGKGNTSAGTTVSKKWGSR